MCEWCGHEHDRRALCSKRPTWGRRGFLALLGAAAVGAVVPAPAVADPYPWLKYTLHGHGPSPVVVIKRKIWARVVIPGPLLMAMATGTADVPKGYMFRFDDDPEVVAWETRWGLRGSPGCAE